MMTHHSPVVYDPAAVCPRWGAVHRRICCGDAEYAAFLQRCVGYWITAAPTNSSCSSSTGRLQRQEYLHVGHSAVAGRVQSADQQ